MLLVTNENMGLCLYMSPNIDEILVFLLSSIVLLSFKKTIILFSQILKIPLNILVFKGAAYSHIFLDLSP